MSESHQQTTMLPDPSAFTCSSIPRCHQYHDHICEEKKIASQAGLIALLLMLIVSILRQRRSRSQLVGVKRSKNSCNILQLARNSSAASLVTFKQVSSSASFARLSEAVRSFNCFTKDCFVPIISAPELFVSTITVSELSLEEISNVIKYAIEHSHSGFNDVVFLETASPHLKEVIVAMDAAVIKSRGVSIRSSMTSGPRRNGDTDALYFCAAMRLFVEWRAVKITPKEYKAYAVGMNVAKRDLVQNTGKVEDAIHRWIESAIESGKQDLSAPTIRQLLEFELTNNVHIRLPKLKDNTAATGIIWMTRQLRFQTEIFANITEVPHSYKTGIEAVRAAYKSVFSPYHGWAIQQVFNYSFNGAPPVSVIFEMMNPSLPEAIDHDFLDVDSEIVGYPVPEVVGASYTSSFDDSSAEVEDDMVSCASVGQALRNPFQELGDNMKKNWDGFASNAEKGWSKFVEDIIQGGKWKQRERAESIDTSLAGEISSPGVPPQRQVRRPSLPKFVLDEQALELLIEVETTKAAHKHIGLYLTVMNPFLTRITAAIEEFGMNDPTRI